MSTSDTLFTSKYRKLDYLWLVYLIFFFIDPIMRGSLRYWLECLGVVSIFLALYVAVMNCNSRRNKLWIIGGMWVLGVVTMPWNGGALAFIIYAGALLPFVIPSPGWVLSGLIFFSACLALECRRLHLSLLNAAFDIFWVFVVGGINIFMAQKQRDDHKLREAQEENFALAAVAERERIARDLHDVLGHTLSIIVLKAELASRLLTSTNPAPDPTRAAGEIADVERIARTALAEVREAIGGYRSRGLGAEIEAARRTLDAAGVTLLLDADTTTATHLSVAEETALSLALREAVTNIVRHACATTCRLRFITEDNRRRVIVEDNGQHAIIREGNGLRGMRARIESLGGHLSLQQDSGTRLLIELPLHEPAAS